MADVDKPVKKYVWAHFEGDPTGSGVILQREDQANTDRGALTTPVVAYDETMGIIETENTVYVPA